MGPTIARITLERLAQQPLADSFFLRGQILQEPVFPIEERRGSPLERHAGECRTERLGEMREPGQFTIHILPRALPKLLVGVDEPLEMNELQPGSAGIVGRSRGAPAEGQKRSVVRLAEGQSTAGGGELAHEIGVERAVVLLEADRERGLRGRERAFLVAMPDRRDLAGSGPQGSPPREQRSNAS